MARFSASAAVLNKEFPLLNFTVKPESTFDSITGFGTSKVPPVFSRLDGRISDIGIVTTARSATHTVSHPEYGLALVLPFILLFI
jgi:hypothetical protein